jgi:hypothetical protein
MSDRRLRVFMRLDTPIAERRARQRQLDHRHARALGQLGELPDRVELALVVRQRHIVQARRQPL